MPKPKVFINNIDKNIKNNIRTSHYKREDNIIKNNDNSKTNIKEEENKTNSVNVLLKINEYFNSEEFVYKFDAEIILNDGTTIYEEIIALKDNALITINGRKINIEDIENIKKANFGL